MTDTSQKPTEVYYKLLSQMTDEICTAGNLTHSQTPKVLKQAGWEWQKQHHLHESNTNELCYLMEAFKITHKGPSFNGYIQHVGIGILHLPMYLQEQADAFIYDCLQPECGILHSDTTGSVVAKSTCQSNAPICLYSAVLARNSLPVVDFLTNNHTSDADIYPLHGRRQM